MRGKSMKIVIVNGSPRKNGATAYILHELEKCLVTQGAEVFFYNLSDQKIAICTGCGACYNLGNCVINDDAEQISAVISKADGIIIGSSTMESNVSGLLKVFMDRGHFVIEQLLKDKYAVAVATYENYGGGNTAKVIKSLLSLSGAKICGTVCKKIPFNSNYTSDTALKEKSNKMAIHIYQDIKRRKKYPVQKLKQRITFEVGIKPFVIKKGKSYEGVLKRWKSIGLL